MAKQTINIGSSANDGTGTTIRAGGDLINDNFNEIYTYLGDGSNLNSALLTIVDEYGTSPSLEYESTWEGGSYSSVAYAVEKKSDGTYCLAIKNTDSGMAGSMWNIYSLTKSGSNAVLSWSDSAWTQSISGYEDTKSLSIS